MARGSCHQSIQPHPVPVGDFIFEDKSFNFVAPIRFGLGPSKIGRLPNTLASTKQTLLSVQVAYYDESEI